MITGFITEVYQRHRATDLSTLRSQCTNDIHTKSDCRMFSAISQSSGFLLASDPAFTREEYQEHVELKAVILERG